VTRNELNRKVYHMIGGMITPALYLLIPSKPAMTALSFALMALVVGFEVLRLNKPSFSGWIQSHIAMQVKDSEQRGLAGQGFMQIAYFVVILLFRRDVAVTAMCFLALGDPLAAIVGMSMGRHKIPGTKKSVEGSLACFAACLVASLLIGHALLGLPVSLALFGAAWATVLELFSLNIDDNFLIPVASAAGMWVVSFMLH
jgi:dolichol kinase